MRYFFFIFTTAGGRVFENRYGLERCFNKSMSSFGPVVYPPAAPPNALPSVELIISTRPITLRNSSVPRPVWPKNPVAWHSSTNTSAPYLSAKLQISPSGAILPSIENTPSVAISLTRAFELANFSSRSAMLQILLIIIYQVVKYPRF